MEFRLNYQACIITAALLSLFAACSHDKLESHGKWDLVRSDSLSDGVPILALYFSDKDHGWAVHPGAVLKLSNNGNDWVPVLTDTVAERTFNSLSFTSSEHGIVVGSQKRSDGYTPLILETNDGGVTWQERPTNVPPVKDIHEPHGLHGISFCNADVGWAVGQGLILRTTDGGKTWDTQRSGNNGERLFSIACASPERAWAAGPDGLLLRTTDEGKTWYREEVESKGSLVRVRFFGEDGWMVGHVAGHGLLLHSRDRGSTWLPQSIDASESLLDIYMTGTQGWIVGTKGTILRTADGGQSWQKQYSPTTNDLACLFFLSSHEGWAAGDKRTLLRYSN
jgi:photosystem II stability/assembly factor-like uncharacterized protein